MIIVFLNVRATFDSADRPALWQCLLRNRVLHSSAGTYLKSMCRPSESCPVIAPIDLGLISILHPLHWSMTGLSYVPISFQLCHKCSTERFIWSFGRWSWPYFWEQRFSLGVCRWYHPIMWKSWLHNICILPCQTRVNTSFLNIFRIKHLMVQLNLRQRMRIQYAVDTCGERRNFHCIHGGFPFRNAFVHKNGVYTPNQNCQWRESIEWGVLCHI